MHDLVRCSCRAREATGGPHGLWRLRPTANRPSSPNRTKRQNRRPSDNQTSCLLRGGEGHEARASTHGTAAAPQRQRAAEKKTTQRPADLPVTAAQHSSATNRRRGLPELSRKKKNRHRECHGGRGLAPSPAPPTCRRRGYRWSRLPSKDARTRRRPSRSATCRPAGHRQRKTDAMVIECCRGPCAAPAWRRSGDADASAGLHGACRARRRPADARVLPRCCVVRSRCAVGQEQPCMGS